jgi:phage terminase large subunit-like protein
MVAVALWSFTGAGVVLAQTIATGEATGALAAPRQELRLERGFDWKGAVAQSGLLLGVQHSLRMFQHKTRVELGGPFWTDYVKSVRGLRGWSDGNPLITNYVGHPMMGAISGFVQIQNDPRGAPLGWDPKSGAYWKSRFKALGWSAGYSTAFELAPFGEAGIGNVGLHSGTMGYVDLVITPLAGFGMVVLEDFLDSAVVSKLEKNGVTKTSRVVRVLLNPQRSLANVLRFERPSHRDARSSGR